MEKKGKIKEHNKIGKLIYEGEFKEGTKNAKGKEDFLDEIISKREYISNNRRKGTAYFKGKLEYKGEYLFYNKWNIKGYDEDDNIICEIINDNGKIKNMIVIL